MIAPFAFSDGTCPNCRNGVTTACMNGQGGALGPLTAGGLAGVAPEDAGAAGGVTNVAHQIGGSLGLGVLVAVFAAADSGALHGPALLAHQISASLTAGTALLAASLAIALIVRGRREPAAHPAATTPTTKDLTCTTHDLAAQV